MENKYGACHPRGESEHEWYWAGAFDGDQFHEEGDPSEEGCDADATYPLLGPRRTFIFNLEDFGITLRGF